MVNQRREVSDYVLERGKTLRGIQASKVDLLHCYVEKGYPDDARPVIEDVRVSDLRLQATHLSCAVLRDITIENLRADMMSAFMFANEFHQVTVRGSVKRLIINTSAPGTEHRDAYRTVIAEHERSDDWSLDISGARGEITIRGYRADRIRRDPATQAVVRWDRALARHWEPLIAPSSYFQVAIDEMLSGKWPDVVLVASRRSPAAFEADLRTIDALRVHKIADPE